MLEALQNHVYNNYNISTPEQKQDFEKKVGFLPGFPVSNEGYPTITLMGGWLLNIPSTSKDKQLA
jgi:multiple sugar transport system substrate-binding protein